jgi:hypothetical protein
MSEQREGHRDSRWEERFIATRSGRWHRHWSQHDALSPLNAIIRGQSSNQNPEVRMDAQTRGVPKKAQDNLHARTAWSLLPAAIPARRLPPVVVWNVISRSDWAVQPKRKCYTVLNICAQRRPHLDKVACFTTRHLGI